MLKLHEVEESWISASCEVLWRTLIKAYNGVHEAHYNRIHCMRGLLKCHSTPCCCNSNPRGCVRFVWLNVRRTVACCICSAHTALGWCGVLFLLTVFMFYFYLHFNLWTICDDVYLNISSFISLHKNHLNSGTCSALSQRRKLEIFKLYSWIRM